MGRQGLACSRGWGQAGMLRRGTEGDGGGLQGVTEPVRQATAATKEEARCVAGSACYTL